MHPQGTPYRPPAGPAGAEPAYEREERGYAAGETARAGFAEHGYPPVSPYPPLPDEDPRGRRPGGAANGGASPYPAYRPYDLDDEAAGDLPLTDYGLPSPQAYGLAPPPPPAEPLPDLEAAEQVYRNEPREAPGHPDDDLEDEETGPPPAEGGPAGRWPPADSGHDGAASRRGRGERPARCRAARRSRAHRCPAPAWPAAAQPDGAGPGLPPARGHSAWSAAPGGRSARAWRAPPDRRARWARRTARARRAQWARRAAGPGADGADFSPLPGDGAVQERETADSLTAEALLHGKRPAPGSGWRRTIFRATGGLVRVGESASSQRRRELIWRARTPVAGGHHRVAVMSLKGGVGKTTTTVGLGATLATLRGDRVIAVDANPDRGTLSDKVRLETSATVRDLLNERQQVHRYADVRAFTSQASSRLEVLASDRDPGVSVAFSEDDYCDVARVLEHYYSICITDCGTGLLHSAMTGVLNLADQIVLVSSPSVDGARSASATLDWLDAHDYGDLVRNAVVVLSTIRPRNKSTVDLDRLEQHFAARCRAVVRVPYDPHLEEGAEVELEQLSPATTEAYLRLAATVGDGFAWPRRALQGTTPAHP